MSANTRIDGVDVIARYQDDFAREVESVRNSVGLSRVPHVACVRVAGADAYDLVDRVVAADVHVRDSQMRHTLLLAPDGRPLADVYLCNDDGDYLLVSEGLERARLVEHLRAHASGDAHVEDLGETHTMLSLNGPFAWEAMSKLEGPEVVGFPYLSFYHPTPDATYFRAGKTGEYGYDLLVPHARAESLCARILDVAAPLDVALVGADALQHCGLENWFFNIHRQRTEGLTPIELQLQWRVSYRKEYVGSAALRERRERGATHRATAVTSETAFATGDAVTYGDRTIGTILDAERSVTVGKYVGVALLELPYAFAGLSAYAVRGEPVQTVSAPFVNNRSLYVNPQKDSYLTRNEIAFGATSAGG